MEFLSVPPQVLFSQLVIGLINGSFYALLSLGLALIFGLLHIGNFAHGAQYMMGAFVAWMLLKYLGISYWWALLACPVIVGLSGVVIERLLIRRIYPLPHIYGLLLTYGMTLLLEGAFRQAYGTAGLSYTAPEALTGGLNLGFMYLPAYRGWVIGVSIITCLATWLIIEKTMLGAYLRAATEKPLLTRGFGINVPSLLTLTYGFGVALAAFAGVMAAPVYQVNPLMGSNLVIVVFAVVVIGGLGSIGGAIVTGFAMGVVEGFTKVFYPEASTTVIFFVMAIVLLIKPAGLFGKAEGGPSTDAPPAAAIGKHAAWREWAILAVLFVVLLAAPFFLYPTFLMKVLCLALFASAFNLLVGYVGLLSFGHAAFFGIAAYIMAHSAKALHLSPELALIAGVAAATILGAIFSTIAIRRRGVYFAMVTLALAQIVYFVILQAPFAGSEDGIQGVPRGRLFGLLDLDQPLNLYYFVLIVFAFAFLAIHRIIDSPFGRVLKAIGEHEPRATSLGYSTDRFKLIVFIISAFFSGLAGAMKALVFQTASLQDIHWSLSGLVVLMTLIGGIGTVVGPAIGALVVTLMENNLAQFGPWVLIIQGAIFVACVLLFRRGIVGEVLALFAPVDKRPSTASGAKAGIPADATT